MADRGVLDDPGRTGDDRLVSAVLAGDPDAFPELVRRHYRPVYAVAYRMLGQRSDAEDATQETFERAWLSVGGFRGDAAFRTWLYRIATNVCIKAQRRRRREVPTELTTETGEPAERRTDQMVEEDMRAASVRAAVAALPDDQRAPLVLREFGDCSYDEIAEILRITPDAVRGRLHRARLELLEAMRAWT